MNPTNSSSTHFGHNQNLTNIPRLNDTLIRMEITAFIQKVNYYITIVEIIMVVCGILGNGLALIVINRRSLRDTSSSVFITYLAIFDISVLVVQITNLIIPYFIQSYIIHCFFTYLTDFVTFCSVWVMVIMTLERCVAVHSPFLAKRFCTTERARYSIYILIGCSLILFSSTFPAIYTIDKSQEKCVVRVQYQTAIRIIKPIIFYFLPDLLLLTNLFVIYELFVAKQQRTKTLINPENPSHQLNAILFNRKQQQLTVMLVTVSLSFYIFTTPVIINYIRQINPPTHYDIKRLKLRFLLTNLSVLWVQMSSATNFIFYCLAGSKFRAACLETFSDIYHFLAMKANKEDPDLRRKQIKRLRTKYDTCATSNTGIEVQNGLINGRKKNRSNSMTQACSYPLNDLSKPPSNETIASRETNSRRQSKVGTDVNEL